MLRARRLTRSYSAPCLGCTVHGAVRATASLRVFIAEHGHGHVVPPVERRRHNLDGSYLKAKAGICQGQEGSYQPRPGGLLPERQGQDLALTASCVLISLDRGPWRVLEDEGYTKVAITQGWRLHEDGGYT